MALVGAFIFFLNINAYGESLSPHVHGVSYMDIAIVDQNLQIELKSPAYNILGFTNPKSKKEKQLYKKALQTLKSISLIPRRLKCETQKIDAFSDEEEEHEEHGDHEEEHHDEHESGHFDIKAHYSYKCKNIKNISFIDTNSFFKEFKTLKEIKVQWIKNNAQGSSSLNATNTKIKF